MGQIPCNPEGQCYGVVVVGNNSWPSKGPACSLCVAGVVGAQSRRPLSVFAMACSDCFTQCSLQARPERTSEETAGQQRSQHRRYHVVRIRLTQLSSLSS